MVDKERRNALLVLALILVVIPLMKFGLDYINEPKDEGNFVVWGKEFKDGTKLLITRSHVKQGSYDVSKESVGSITDMITIHSVRSFSDSLSKVLDGTYKVSSCL